MLLLSRHPTHRAIKKKLPSLPFRTVIRLGSQTEVANKHVSLNTPQGVRNAADKLLMKQCFDTAGVKTAPWWHNDHKTKGLSKRIEGLKYPQVAKHRFGSRGTGVYKINDDEEMKRFLGSHDAPNYIFEQFKPYNREYRLHVWE